MSMPSCTPDAGRGAPPVTRHDKAGDEFAVRAYEPADRRALERFYEEFEPKRAAQGLPPVGSRRIRAWLDSVLPVGIHLLAFRGAALIGHAFVVPTPRPGIGEYSVFLRHDQRGRGVGSGLNHVAVAAARDAGLKGLWLTVEPHNRAAIGSYERAGFRYVPATIFSVEAEMELPLGPDGGS